MTKTEMIQILSGFIGSIGFAVLFNIRGKRLMVTAIGGLLSWLLLVLINKHISNDPIAYFIVACAISGYAEIMARVLKTPTTTFITTSLIPLIPGASLYYTMVYAFRGDASTFLPKAMYTMQLTAALALGVITSTAIVRVFNETLSKKRNKM